jgi:hypothetical protein
VLTAHISRFHAKVTGPDGGFQVAVLPGPGHLLVWAPTPDYVPLETTERRLTNDQPGGQRWYFDGLLKYDLKPQAEPVERKLTVRRGVTVRGRLVGPDGKPVAKAQMLFRPLYDMTGAYPSHYPATVRDGRFELRGCDPDKTYTVLFLDPQGQLGARAEIAGKQAGGEPVTVRLAPCVTARGRYQDAGGKPVKGHVGFAQVIMRPGCARYDFAAFEKGQTAVENVPLGFLDEAHYSGGPRSDAEGRIVYPSLIPGVTYRLDGAAKDLTAEAGKALELGDIVIK